MGAWVGLGFEGGDAVEKIAGEEEEGRREMGDGRCGGPTGRGGGVGWVSGWEREASLFVWFGFMTRYGGQVGLGFGHPTKIQREVILRLVWFAVQILL
jgi:hypothetical protein